MAHYLADEQADIGQETYWDEVAIASFPHIEDDELNHVGITSASAFEPSLRLNLADDYLREGGILQARTHHQLAVKVVDILGDDGSEHWSTSPQLDTQKREHRSSQHERLWGFSTLRLPRR